jgi:hypothetical protein
MSSVNVVGHCLCHKHDNKSDDPSAQSHVAKYSQNLIISVGEARKILGADVNGLSDEDIEENISGIAEMCGDILKLTLNRGESS